MMNRLLLALALGLTLGVAACDRAEGPKEEGREAAEDSLEAAEDKVD